MATMKKIADLAGVSRGTVDRVLNNRGSVNPETAQRIREIAAALEYSPNRAGKTLALKKKNLKLGCILFGSTASNPYFEDVVAGILEKAAEFTEYGVTVELRDTPLGDAARQCALMEELAAAGVDGLVITPMNHPDVAAKIQALKKRGVPVVTTNSDIADSGRLAYVGSNFLQSGETAGALMGMITGGTANVGVVLGSPLVLCHSQRVEGFGRQLALHYPGVRIVNTVVNNDDDLESFEVTKRLLQQSPEIDALFLAAAGVGGASRAVQDLGLAGQVKIVSFDTTPVVKELLRQGVIQATLGQQPKTQGTKPLDILLDYLGMGIAPEKEYFYTGIEIKIRENL